MHSFFVRSDSFPESFTLNISLFSIGFHGHDIAILSHSRQQQLLKPYVVGDCSGIRLPQGAAALATVIVRGRWKHPRQSHCSFKVSILRIVPDFCAVEHAAHLPRTGGVSYTPTHPRSAATSPWTGAAAFCAMLRLPMLPRNCAYRRLRAYRMNTRYQYPIIS